MSESIYVEWPISIWALLTRQRLSVQFYFNKVFYKSGIHPLHLRSYKACQVCKCVHYDIYHDNYIQYTFDTINNFHCFNVLIQCFPLLQKALLKLTAKKNKFFCLKVVCQVNVSVVHLYFYTDSQRESLYKVFALAFSKS